MSRTLSNAPGSDSPLKSHLVAKAPYSNAKLTRQQNHRELRHDMLNVSLVVEPEKFLELFVPEPTLPAGKQARPKPTNPFTNMEKPTTERKMYEEYPKALNKIIRGTPFAFVATPYKADNTTDPKLAVDCGMYPRKRVPKKDQTKGMDPAKRKDFRRVCWSGIDLPAECKLEDDPFDDNVDSGRPHSDKRRDASGQALSYIELTYHHQNRTFVFMLIFIGVHCRLLRVDHSGLFVSKRFNITQTDFLVEFLWRYTQLSPEARGYDTTAKYINPARDSLAKLMKERLAQLLKVRDEDESEAEDDDDREEPHVIKLWQDALNEKWPWWKLCIPDEVTGKDRFFLTGKPSFQAPGIRGRGTRCYIAIELFQRGKKHVLDTKFVYLKDCWRVVVDGASDEAMDIQKEGATLTTLNKAKVQHVPTLVAHGDIDDQVTTAHEAWREVNGKFKCRMKTHRHYRLVVKEIGKPLSDFEDSGELVLALYDCLRAHRDAMDAGIIHRDISGGNILLYKSKGKKGWRGLLTDWELSKDSNVHPNPRQLGRTGTLQFSAVRVLDKPEKTITVSDEIESFFHVLIYYSVRFLQHNLEDKYVGPFLNKYFDPASGLIETGKLVAPDLKRSAMTMGKILLEPCGGSGVLQFKWVNVNELSQPPAAPNSGPSADYYHPLNKLIRKLLSWFQGLYTLYRSLDTVVVSDPSQARVGGRVPLVDSDDSDDADSDSDDSDDSDSDEPEGSSTKDWKRRAAKLRNHSAALKLFRKTIKKTFPRDKGNDKRAEKGYTPRSPETPQFSELSSFSGSSPMSASQLEDTDALLPDGPAPNAFAELLAATADREQEQPQAPAAEPEAAEGVELDGYDGPRTPSPCPSRPKRGREDDVAPNVLGASEKRSRC